MKKNYEWVQLYQYEGIKIEELLKVCMQKFEEKHGHKPQRIYVNEKVELRMYEGIHVIGDRQMYSLGIVGLVI